MRISTRLLTGSVVCFVSLLAVTSLAAQLDDKAKTHRYLSCKVRLYSYIPGKVVETYRSSGGGSFSKGGTLGTGTTDSIRDFRVSASGRGKAAKLTATLSVTPGKRDTDTKALNQTIDLSDLQPRTIRIARNEDGRVYELALIPQFNEKSLPVVFDPLAMRLEFWSFNSSPVILDDRLYAGRINMSGGQVIGIDISGVANVEFSMLKMTDAEPLGVLKDGTLTIHKEAEHTLSITGIRHGAVPHTLPGGPYVVWVRWKEPSTTAEEAREALTRQLQKIEAQLAAGTLTMTDAQLNQLRDMAKVQRPTLLGSSSRHFKPGERVVE